MALGFARGIRNNNPGNLENANQGFLGTAKAQTDPRFLQFEDPVYGIRALAKTLGTYQSKYGLNTVKGIINRYAPSSENDTDAYIKAVSSDIGVNPDEPLDIYDPGTSGRLIKAIIKHENASQPYDDETIGKGIQLAFGGDVPGNLQFDRSLQGQTAENPYGAELASGVFGFGGQQVAQAPNIESLNDTSTFQQDPAQLPAQQPAQSRSLIPQFDDNPVGAIALVIEEMTASLLGKPSPLKQLQEQDLRRRRVEMEEYKVGLDLLDKALSAAEGGNLDAGFALIDNSPMGDAQKGELRSMLQSTVQLGQERARNMLGVFDNASARLMVTSACGSDTECIQGFMTDPKKFEMLQQAADRQDLPIVQAKVDQIVKKLPQILENVAEGGVTYTELSGLLRDVRKQDPKAFTASEEQTILRNAPDILAPYGLTFVPQEEEVKRAAEIEKEGRAEGRTIAAEARAETRTLSTEERAQQRTIEAEERAQQRKVDDEQRALDRTLDAEKRAEERALASEARADDRSLSAEDRAEARKIAAEQRSSLRELAKERREAEKALEAEKRNLEDFKTRKTFEEDLKRPKSDLVDESGNLKNEVSGSIQRQAAVLVGGSVNSFGEFIGLTPETSQQALDIVVEAERAILSGEANSVGQAVQQAQKKLSAQRPVTAKAPVEQPTATDLSSVPEGVDIAQATGASGIAGRAVNAVGDFLALGLAFPEVAAATETLTKLQTATGAALARGVKDRPAQELIREFKREFAVGPDMAGDERALKRLEGTVGFLKQRLAVQENVLEHPGDFKKEDVSSARLSAVELRDLIATYERIIQQFDTPGNKGGGTGMPRLRLNPDTNKLESVQ